MALCRWSWLLPALLCLLLGYLSVWQRGLYLDDYINRNAAINPLTGQWRPLGDPFRIPYFPTRSLTWLLVTTLAGLAPAHELLVRIGLAAGAGLNALLLGWLAYRLLGSRLAAVVAGWLVLMPIFAQEVVLWIGSSGYLLAAAFMLLFLHACWSALTHRCGFLLWLALASLAFLGSLLCVEALVATLGLVPLLALAAGARSGHLALWQRAMRGGALVVAPLLAGTALYRLIYYGSSYVASRGGLDLSPGGLVMRAQGVLAALVWKTVAPGWGLALLAEGFTLGVGVVVHTPVAAALFVLTVAAAIFTLATWPADREAAQADAWRHGLVAATGLAWAVGTLLLPVSLVPGQMLEPRLLYFPMAGLALAVGATLSWLAQRLRRPLAERTVLAITGLLLLGATLCLAGDARAYAARSALDQQQLAAFLRALPPADLPPDVFLVAVDTDERLAGVGDPLAQTLTGVFETPWSAYGALTAAYRRPDLWLITGSRWAPPRFAYLGGHKLVARPVTVDDRGLPLDRTILFRYRDGQMWLIRALTLEDPNGATHTVQFPLAEALAQPGQPVLAEVRVPNRLQPAAR